MQRWVLQAIFCICIVSVTAVAAAAAPSKGKQTDPVSSNALALLEEGRQTFRFDTFGDEKFWGSTINLHRAIAGSTLGGVGHGLSPKTALGLGLKVDLDMLPKKLVATLKAGKVNLDDPATTLALLKLNSVVGVKGIFDARGALVSAGITCALCHSTVDDAFVPGIGHRRDGWPNRDLNVGAIVALAPNLDPVAARLHTDVESVKKVLTSWGPGRYDAEMLEDGKAFRPDGKTAAVLIPAASGLGGVNLHTYGGWGGVAHWNAYVANTQMHGMGTFYDPRLNNKEKYPIAAKNRDYDMHSKPDLITPKLAALQLYQLAIPAPAPAEGTFDKQAAERGRIVFMIKASCGDCHVPPLYTEPGYNMHTAAEIGIDDFQAKRSPDEMYRTTPLKGLFARQKGGFYHDGRFETYLDVVNHYEKVFSLGLNPGEKRDLVEFLKSL